MSTLLSVLLWASCAEQYVKLTRMLQLNGAGAGAEGLRAVVFCWVTNSRCCIAGYIAAAFCVSGRSC